MGGPAAPAVFALGASTFWLIFPARYLACRAPRSGPARRRAAACSPTLSPAATASVRASIPACRNSILAPGKVHSGTRSIAPASPPGPAPRSAAAAPVRRAPPPCSPAAASSPGYCLGPATTSSSPTQAPWSCSRLFWNTARYASSLPDLPTAKCGSCGPHPDYKENVGAARPASGRKLRISFLSSVACINSTSERRNGVELTVLVILSIVFNICESSRSYERHADVGHKLEHGLVGSDCFDGKGRKVSMVCLNNGNTEKSSWNLHEADVGKEQVNSRSISR